MTTLGATVDTYFKRRGKETRYWQELEARFRVHFIRELGGRDRVLATISKAELRALIEAKEDEGYPVAARTMWESFNPFFKWCVSRDLIISSPMASLPAPAIPEARDRVLAKTELKAVWKACNAMPYWGPFFKVLMLTMQRRNAVAGMHYAEISAENIWVIPRMRMKNKKTHDVHLSQQVLDIISRKPSFIDGNPSGFSKAKRKLDAQSGVHAWCLHDLRRTGASCMQELGVAESVIELVLAHKKKGIKGVYQRYQYMPQRKEALELWGLYLDTL